MDSSVELEVGFVDAWMNARKKDERLSLQILELIDRHRNGSAIDEAGLLESLAALSLEEGDPDAADSTNDD